MKISKAAINFPTLSRKAKRSRRNEGVYPPRIVITVSKIEKARWIRPVGQISQLHVNVKGIADQSSVCQGFDLLRINQGKISHH